MAKTKVTVKVSSGKQGNSPKLTSQKVRISKVARGQGKPIYQTAAQLTAHFYYGQRPTQTRLRRANN